MLLITEILGDGETSQRNAQPGTRRFIHLPVDQCDLGVAQFLLLDDSRRRHFVIEIISLSGAFSYPRKDRDTPMKLGDVVDQFHDDDRLAHTGATESPDLTALRERTDQIDDLDSRGKYLRRCGLVHQRRWLAMDGVIFVGL